MKVDLHALVNFVAWIVLPLLAVVALAACAPVRVLNALASGRGSQRLSEGVAYGGLPRQKLDIYTPSISAPADGWPDARCA